MNPSSSVRFSPCPLEIHELKSYYLHSIRFIMFINNRSPSDVHIRSHACRRDLLESQGFFRLELFPLQLTNNSLTSGISPKELKQEASKRRHAANLVLRPVARNVSGLKCEQPPDLQFIYSFGSNGVVVVAFVQYASLSYNGIIVR